MSIPDIVAMTRPTRTPNLGLADLGPALDALAAALREHHPPELRVWAVTQLAALVDLPVVVGDPEDPYLTAELHLQAAQESVSSLGTFTVRTPSPPETQRP